MAQLVEWSLPITEVRGLNPVIGKNLFILNICLLSTMYCKDENKEIKAGNGPFLKKPLGTVWSNPKLSTNSLNVILTVK